MRSTIIKISAFLFAMSVMQPVAANSDCAWPDSGTLEAILPIATDHGSHASGIVFSQNRVLTAAHALAGADQVFVKVSNDFRLARVLILDQHSDLAVLSIDTENIEPVRMTLKEPIDRQAVWAVGFPRAQGKTTSRGEFQRNRHGALHTSAGIDSGQSGGGLLICEEGSYQLLGMLRGYGAYLSGDRYVKLENHSVSVAAATIHAFVTPVTDNN
ncbi:MAG: serine protease [Gammaproteobacteria bacterium]|nr:serine protease [Gammaproteobacteria bacterium]